MGLPKKTVSYGGYPTPFHKAYLEGDVQGGGVGDMKKGFVGGMYGVWSRRTVGPRPDELSRGGGGGEKYDLISIAGHPRAET